MKTEVYSYDIKNFDFDKVRFRAEQAAKANDLNNKQLLRLTLLSEELANMLPNLLENGNGEIWIENHDRNFEIHTIVTLNELLHETEMRRLLSVSRTGHNAAAVGIGSKFRIAVERMLANYLKASKINSGGMSNIYEMGMINSSSQVYHWSLEQYKHAFKKDDWDKLEKSLITNFADDVSVGIIKGKAEIIIKKWFDKE